MPGGVGSRLRLGARVRGPEDVGDALVEFLVGSLVPVAFALDLAGRIVAYHCGTTLPCSGEPFNPAHAMRVDAPGVKASGVIVAHAHEGASTVPFEEDLAATQALMLQGRVEGIELVDHIIVAGRSWRSLREATSLWG